MTVVKVCIRVVPIVLAAGLVPRASRSQGAFAYADSSGARLLALSAPSSPTSVVEALCRSGARLPIRFVGHQSRSPGDNGRQRASNFDYEEGDVFEVARGSARPDETCFLAPPPAAKVPRTPADSVCAAGDSTRLSQAKARRVVSCRRIVTVDDLTHVLAVEFERRADSALASLVLTDRDQMSFLDFPAARGPEGDAWRVGDGGTFDPSGFGVLFVVNGPAERAIAVAWAGEEGESLVFAATGPARGAFEPLVRDYRYWVP
jgi:hypothetical protein